MSTDVKDFNKFIVTYPGRESLYDTYELAEEAAKRRTNRDTDGDVYGIWKAVAYPKAPVPVMEMVTVA
jgi:hypothetical protein